MRLEILIMMPTLNHQAMLPLHDAIVTDTVCDSLVARLFSEGFGKEMVPLPRVAYDVLEGWNLILLGLVLLVVVLNKQLYPRQFRQVLSVPRGAAHTNQLLREWSPLGSFLGVTSIIVYVLVAALFLQKSCVVLSRDVATYNSFHSYVVFLGCVAGWALLRYVVLYFFGWLFRTKDVVDRQVTVELSVSMITFILLQPVLWILLYNPYSAFVWIGLIIMSIANLMRLVMEFLETRVVVKDAPFYIFLYFCSLEIIPWMLLLVAGLRYFSQGSAF